MKTLIIVILDVFLATGFFLLIPPLMILVASILRLTFKSPQDPPCLLTLTSGSVEAASKRNIGFIYRASPLDGYFKRCIFLFYLSDRSEKIAFSPEITLIDFRNARADALKFRGFRLLSHLLQEISFFFYTARLIRTEKVTVMQANDPYIQGAHALLLSIATRVPYVVRMVCDYDHYYEKFGRLAFPVLRFRALENAIEYIVLRFADGVIPWTENYKCYALKKGARPERTVIVPAFVDPRYFDANATDKTLPIDPNHHPLLIYLGRLSWDKYCLDLVECMRAIADRHPEVRLVILGDGELREEFETKARDLGVEKNIHIAGMQTIDQILAWAKAARVMLAPHAGFSLVEMGAVGIPVVAYDYEWHSELVEDGKSGFIVPFRDPKAMAEAAIKIIANPAMGASMAKIIREKTHREHHPDRVRENMTQFFKNLSTIS